MANEVTVTRGNFDAEVMRSTVPVIADFWAEWCGPCKMISPMLSDIARAYNGRIKIARIDSDAEPELAQRFNVMSMPTILIFDKGAVVRQQVGAVPRNMLERLIRDVI